MLKRTEAALEGLREDEREAVTAFYPRQWRERIEQTYHEFAIVTRSGRERVDVSHASVVDHRRVLDARHLRCLADIGEAVDRAARQVVEDAGYGDHFIHRTGHGIGLEGHEHPYIVNGNELPLEPGMTFSIEPGIYIPGEFGVRVEDIVACGPEAVDDLNAAERSLVEVG